ncbi:MAG: hypothetical protein WD226_08330 [Planctomycetota bacterium]
MGRRLDYNATLVRRIDLAERLRIFRFRSDFELPAAPWFVPGQSVVLGLNNEAWPEHGSTKRAMSIASSAENREEVEFYVRFVDEPVSKSPLTHLLWQLVEGDRAFVRPAPKGRFTVPDLLAPDDARLRLFVAAGTGLAPFVSIVRTFRDQWPGASLERFAIVHGASYSEELGYRAELEHLAAEAGLRYVPTISRAAERPGWTGAAGRAEDLLRSERLAELERGLALAPGELRPERVAVFVCGLRGTIARSIERLTLRGFVPDHGGVRRALGLSDDIPPSLFFEQYDTEPVIDLRDAVLCERLGRQLRGAL